MEFFKVEEINRFNNFIGHPYRKGNDADKMIDDELKYGVWEKTNHWSRLLKAELSTHSVEINNKRTQLGGRGKPSKFKPYTWATICKKGDEDNCIYFTIGVDAGRKSLLTKIHYQKSKPRAEGSASLSQDQRRICSNLMEIGDEYAYYEEIKANELKGWNWDKLLNETIHFIKRHESTYQSLIKIVWPDPGEEPKNSKLIKPFVFTPGSSFTSNKLGPNTYVKERRTRVHFRLSLASRSLGYPQSTPNDDEQGGVHGPGRAKIPPSPTTQKQAYAL